MLKAADGNSLLKNLYEIIDDSLFTIFSTFVIPES